MTFSLRMNILMIGILLLQMVSACATQTSAAPPSQTQSLEPQSTTIVRVTMPDTEVRQLKSSATGRNYDIYVRTPDQYAQENGKKYPVIYVLDGQWDFKLLDSISGGLIYDKFVPEVIIVGITYSGDHPDYGALRAMDYTPVSDIFISGSGDAPKFFAFLKGQLIPFIESNYRVDPSQRVLMGSSYGGTFTLFALFSEPSLFRGYVAASPVVVYGNQFAFKQEAEYASSHKDLPVRLFLSVGEIEELAGPVKQFMQVLNERNYTGLEIETRIIEAERHAGNKPEAYNRGLRFIFQDE
ncbi:MAG TPA: alpha/beta hydrolase-fold protein [Anaerolineales bacterium]|nr:alpha/beta hydrolase-fold protein [Anaerolineales bacterium]